MDVAKSDGHFVLGFSDGPDFSSILGPAQTRVSSWGFLCLFPFSFLFGPTCGFFLAGPQESAPRHSAAFLFFSLFPLSSPFPLVGSCSTYELHPFCATALHFRFCWEHLICRALAFFYTKMVPVVSGVLFFSFFSRPPMFLMNNLFF